MKDDKSWSKAELFSRPINNEENNANNLDITLEIDELIFANQTIEIENNKTFKSKK